MILPDSKIENATSKNDVARPYLRHVYLDTAEQHLIATDGHILASIPVQTDPGDTAGFITVDAIKAARKAKTVIRANDTLAVENGPTFPRPTAENEGDFPDYKKVIPEPSPFDFTIGIDAELLLRLAQAICANPKKPIVRLRFRNAKDENGGYGIAQNLGIRVETFDPDRFGVIMPCRVD